VASVKSILLEISRELLIMQRNYNLIRCGWLGTNLLCRITLDSNFVHDRFFRRLLHALPFLLDTIIYYRNIEYRSQHANLLVDTIFAGEIAINSNVSTNS